MDEAGHHSLIELPYASNGVVKVCVVCFSTVALISLMRLRVAIVHRQWLALIFHLIMIVFCFCRVASFLITQSTYTRDLFNRASLCSLFTLFTYQISFWIYLIDPIRRRSAPVNLIAVNLLFYALVFVVDLFPHVPDRSPTYHRTFLLDTLPAVCVAFGCLSASVGLVMASYSLRTRVIQMVDTTDVFVINLFVTQNTVQKALTLLVIVLGTCSAILGLRSIFYILRPWSTQECGIIPDPSQCIIFEYLIPEVVPCALLLALMWNVEPGLRRGALYFSGDATYNARHEISPLLPTRRRQVKTDGRARSLLSSLTPSRADSFDRPPRKSPVTTPKKDLAHMWMSLKCIDMTFPETSSHGFIVVYGSRTEIGRTEILSIDFCCYSVMLPVEVVAGSQYKFCLYSARDNTKYPEANEQNLIGETVVTFAKSDCREGAELLHRLTNDLGVISIRIESFVLPSYDLTESMPSRISRLFSFSSVENKIVLVEEILTESPYTWEVPYQMLQLIASQVAYQIKSLEGQSSAKTTLQSATPKSNRAMSAVVAGVRQKMKTNFDVEWHEEILLRAREYAQVVKVCMNTCQTSGDRLSFKPSTLKADSDLRFVALNLQQQLFLVGSRANSNRKKSFQGGSAYSTTTVGAFAAHIYGFKDGGIRQINREIGQLEAQIAAREDDEKQKFGLSSLQRKYVELCWTADRRMDVAFCQALSALITCFQQTLFAHLHAPDRVRSEQLFLRQILEIGFLFSVESLLSTYGAEAGMLGDMDAAVKELSKVSITLRRTTSATRAMHRVLIKSRSDGRIYVELPLIDDPSRRDAKVQMCRIHGQDLYTGAVYFNSHDDLSSELETDSFNIDIVPILFTQGVNEMQTVANTVGKSALQHEINYESLDELRSYYGKYINFRKRHRLADTVQNIEGVDTDQILELVEKKIQQATTGWLKQMDILILTSGLARLIGGGRVTCCKSAKDRTSMAVTLDQAILLVQNHGLAKNQQADVANLFRSFGVRRENARMNIGKAQYCFSTLQNFMLPSEYKCPPGTGGGNRSQS